MGIFAFPSTERGEYYTYGTSYYTWNKCTQCNILHSFYDMSCYISWNNITGTYLHSLASSMGTQAYFVPTFRLKDHSYLDCSSPLAYRRAAVADDNKTEAFDSGDNFHYFYSLPFGFRTMSRICFPLHCGTLDIEPTQGENNSLVAVVVAAAVVWCQLSVVQLCHNPRTACMSPCRIAENCHKTFEASSGDTYFPTSYHCDTGAVPCEPLCHQKDLAEYYYNTNSCRWGSLSRQMICAPKSLQHVQYTNHPHRRIAADGRVTRISPANQTARHSHVTCIVSRETHLCDWRAYLFVVGLMNDTRWRMNSTHCPCYITADFDGILAKVS